MKNNNLKYVAVILLVKNTSVVSFSSLVVRWWARQIVKNIPPSDMLEVRAKVAALTALSGERKDWGVSRAWERDYLSNVRTTP